MVKSFKCTDIGTPCDWSATTENEQALMQKIKEHAHRHHGKIDIPVDKVMTAIKDD